VQPPWYTGFENWLLGHGQGTITLILLGLIAGCAFWLWRVRQGRNLLPAAAWITWLLLP